MGALGSCLQSALLLLPWSGMFQKLSLLSGIPCILEVGVLGGVENSSLQDKIVLNFRSGKLGSRGKQWNSPQRSPSRPDSPSRGYCYRSLLMEKVSINLAPQSLWKLELYSEIVITRHRKRSRQQAKRLCLEHEGPNRSHSYFPVSNEEVQQFLQKRIAENVFVQHQCQACWHFEIQRVDKKRGDTTCYREFALSPHQMLSSKDIIDAKNEGIRSPTTGRLVRNQQDQTEHPTEKSTRLSMAELASSPEFTGWILLPDDSSLDTIGSGSDSRDENVAESCDRFSFFKWYLTKWTLPVSDPI
ncbi:hypothetical protein RHMOL_Rhmol03G0082600 [Rhododendron molle]|uniref:Uncharacterized protein n=1 Tax=Rhododendron molle TaxID=49168 RepID=A0ACC0PD29_RHOML|nr:hypothetical protein RHMOL_Rhmol03G0082600 [Rhododendron molle]